jgi:hypothetical protein
LYRQPLLNRKNEQARQRAAGFFLDANHPGANLTRYLFAGYLALLVLAPIPLGSNRPWAWALLELWVFILAIGWLFGYARGKHHRNAAFNKSWPALACGAVWLGYVWFQLVPLLPEVLKALSRRRRAGMRSPRARPASKPPRSRSIGTARCRARSRALLISRSSALSLLLLDRRERVSAAAFTLVVSGFAQAMFEGFPRWRARPESPRTDIRQPQPLRGLPGHVPLGRNRRPDRQSHRRGV